MLLMVMAGSGQMTKRAQFTTSVDGAQSTIQKYYEEVVNGVNTRDATTPCGGSVAPGTDSCLLLGRVITVSTDKKNLLSWYVTGSLTSVPGSDTVYARISDSRGSFVVPATPLDSSEISWGAEAMLFSRESSPLPTEQVSNNLNRTKVNSIAFIRDPAGTQVLPYFFESDNPEDASSVQSALRWAVESTRVATTSQSSAALCINNPNEWGVNSPVAAIMLRYGVGASAIDTDYNPVRGASGVC